MDNHYIVFSPVENNMSPQFITTNFNEAVEYAEQINSQQH